MDAREASFGMNLVIKPLWSQYLTSKILQRTVLHAELDDDPLMTILEEAGKPSTRETSSCISSWLSAECIIPYSACVCGQGKRDAC